MGFIMSTIKSLNYNRSLRKNTTIFEMHKSNKLMEVVDQQILVENELIDKPQYDLKKRKSQMIMEELPFVVRLWNFLK